MATLVVWVSVTDCVKSRFFVAKQRQRIIYAPNAIHGGVARLFSGICDRDSGGCFGCACELPESTRAAFSKQRWFEVVAVQQFIKLGSIALGNTCRLGDIALGDLHDTHQIIALEPALRLCQR